MTKEQIEQSDPTPALGRREFFGLCLWRIAKIGAGIALVSEMGKRTAMAIPGGNPCSGGAPNLCTGTTPNICGTAYGHNNCNGGWVNAPGNICRPPGTNSCRSTQPPGAGWNACAGSAGSVGNLCDGGTATNYCTSVAGANTCTSASQGVGNCCSGLGTNSCQPANANACIPPSANSEDCKAAPA
jgi:hypothetical protein